jgi:hypothetical protein
VFNVEWTVDDNIQGVTKTYETLFSTFALVNIDTRSQLEPHSANATWHENIHKSFVKLT